MRFSTSPPCIALIAAMAVQLAVSAAVAPMSAGAAGPSCPPREKSCVMVGEPPAPGVYKFKPGSSGPDYNLAGRLTVTRTKGGYDVGGLQMHLGQKAGCTLNGDLATAEGVFPLQEKTKVTAFGNGTKEISTTWRLPNTKVKMKAGGKVYSGELFAAFLTPAPGEALGVTGNLTFTAQEGAVCGGSFLGHA